MGTPALATRGFQADDFREIGRVIAEALTGEFHDSARADLSERTLFDVPASTQFVAKKRLSLRGS